MELSNYLKIIYRRKWTIILTTLLITTVFTLISLLIPHNFKASAIIHIDFSRLGTPTYPQLIYADRILNTYVEIATSSQIMNELRQTLGIDEDYELNVKIEIIPETELLQITVEDPDRILARDAANTLAATLVNLRQVVGSRIYVVDYAPTPDPISIFDIAQLSIIGFLIGGIFGVVFAFLIENLDPKIYEKEEIKDILDVDTIGEIPSVWRWGKEKYQLNFLENDDAFRRLRTNLIIQSRKKPFTSLMFNSSQPGEGKSTILANLALSISRVGHKVIVIDADFHRPCLHKFFGIKNQVGLCDLLLENTTLENAIKICEDTGIAVLPSGELSLESVESLGSHPMFDLLEQLKQEYDFVFLDSPAFMGVSDAAMLTQVVDGVILVVRIGYSRSDTLQETYQQLNQSNAAVIGVVVNSTREALPIKYKTYYRYSFQPDKPDQVVEAMGHTEPSSSVLNQQHDDQDIETEIIAPSTLTSPEEEVAVLERNGLRKIKGIGTAFEKALNAIGIDTISKLATSDAEEISVKTKVGRKIKKSTLKRWIEQAKMLINQNNNTG